VGEVAQLITAIAGLMAAVLPPAVALIIALRKGGSDQEQDVRLAEIERRMQQRRRDGEAGGTHRTERGDEGEDGS
jgi:hypothetical protein